MGGAIAKVTLPAIGLGTGPSRGPDGVALMAEALRLGYRLLDTAAHYHNEREVGEAVRASGVDRDEVFIITKVWPDRQHSADLRRSIEESLEYLGLSHVDLFLLHWPNPEIPLAETIEALNAAREDGLTRHIGVSNFPTRMLNEAMKLSAAPLVANEIEYHPYLNQDAVLADCRAHGIVAIAHCPLGRVGTLFAEPAISLPAIRHGKTPAQIVLRWHIQQPGVVPIPGTTRPERLKENLAIFDFALSEEEMAAISALSAKDHRICAPPIPYAWD